MSTNERPGVYTSYTVTSSLAGSGSGGAVGLAAAATGGTAGTVTAIGTYAEALAAFGGGAMTTLVRLLLQNGAPLIYAVPVAGGDYESAFAALMGVEDVRFMVCDSRDAAVHAALRAAIAGADERGKYRIGIVESAAETRAELVSAAAALDSERMVLVSHHESEGTAGSVAAAVCGAIAAESDPAIPLNGAVLNGLGAIGTNFSDGDITLLVRGGVTTVETVGGAVTVIRGVTTRTTSGGAPDSTWRELTTVLVVDTLLPALRDSLRARFARSKNTAQSRGAIRTQVIIELEEALRREYIDGYSDVRVAADSADPTVCVVSFQFAVAHGLNRLELQANITV